MQRLSSRHEDTLLGRRRIPSLPEETTGWTTILSKDSTDTYRSQERTRSSSDRTREPRGLLCFTRWLAPADLTTSTSSNTSQTLSTGLQ